MCINLIKGLTPAVYINRLGLRLFEPRKIAVFIENFFRGSSYRLQSFMNVYRHISISTFDIKWDTNLISIPEASYEKIENLIQRKLNYPKVQDALRLIDLGNSSYLEIAIEDNQSDKHVHVILAHRRTENGMRQLIICEFRQCSSLSVGGLIGTILTAGAISWINPAVGILSFTAKVAADYALSKHDVSIIVATKELVHAGFLRLNGTTMQIELP